MDEYKDEILKDLKLPTEMEISLSDLPNAGEIFDEVEAGVTNYLSDKTGFCHEGYELEIKIKASKIKWDVDYK